LAGQAALAGRAVDEARRGDEATVERVERGHGRHHGHEPESGLAEGGPAEQELGYADFSCWWSSTWLIEVATREVTTNSAPMAMSMPRWMWAGWRTSSALVVTHSKALKRKTPRATASMNEAGCGRAAGRGEAQRVVALRQGRHPDDQGGGEHEVGGDVLEAAGDPHPRRLEATAAPRSPRIHSAATTRARRRRG